MTSPTPIPAQASRPPLYRPVKRFLERLGYEVKGEIGGCDLVGVSQDGTVVVIGELKLRFNLDLLLQAPRSASNMASATVTMVLATIIWLTSLES